MKDLSVRITEGLILESAAKDVKIPRKGSTVYILKDGESKVIPIKVKNVEKIKNAWYGNSGGYDVYIELEDNIYTMDGWRTMHYADPKLDAPIQIDIKRGGKGELFYIGTSKEVISEYIKIDATNKLKQLLKEIEDAENQLVKLNKRKDELQQKIDIEITESLNN